METENQNLTQEEIKKFQAVQRELVWGSRLQTAFLFLSFLGIAHLAGIFKKKK